MNFFLQILFVFFEQINPFRIVTETIISKKEDACHEKDILDNVHIVHSNLDVSGD